MFSKPNLLNGKNNFAKSLKSLKPEIGKRWEEGDVAMSVFVFDNDALDMIRYILAMQHFKEYMVGPEALKAYLCAISFERVLIQTGLKFPKFQKENASEIRSHDVIRFLQQKSLITPKLANELIEFDAFHNSLMTKGAQIPAEKNNFKFQEILLFLCGEAGINLNEESEKRTFEDIVALKTEQFSDNKNYEVIESDFDNLDKLYEKCPFIQREIEKKLTVPLKGAQISGFAPNTGGIWLPFVTHETSDKRGHIDRASIGVSFTPNAIRIGLNFGTHAHKYRIKYYELLLNGELMSAFESLNRKDTGYCLCDTFWYYQIRNIQSLQWSLTLYGSTKITIEKAIEETKQLEGNPLTANRYLISKVINRRPEDFAYFIKGIIDAISKSLNELYPIIALIDKT